MNGTRPPPDAALCEAIADAARTGHRLAASFMDHARPAPQSTLEFLAARLSHLIPDRPWPPEDFRFLTELLRGLVGVAGSQVLGVAALFAAGPPIGLHPAATVARGAAEAIGKIWWHCEPWIDDSGQAQELPPAAWDERSARVLARTQLAWLDTVAERRRRIGATNSQSSPEYAAVERDLQELKHRLETFHAGSPDLVLTGGRRAWRVAGEAMPESTTLVTAATEYSYGQQTRGTGHNPYPLYSGYAHASLELIFAHAGPTYRGPLSPLMACDVDEARRLAGVALRGLAAGYEIAAAPFGWDLDAFRDWETRVDELIVETDDGGR